MAISTTTFEQRIARIQGGKTPHSKELARKNGKSGRKGKGLFSVPFLLGFGILTGGAAYAWVESQPSVTWMMAFAG